MNLLDKNSLKLKLVVASIIAVILPMFFATAYSTRKFLENSQNEIKYTLESELNSVDIVLKSHMKSFSELGKSIAHNFALVTPLQFDMKYQVKKYGTELLNGNSKIDEIIIKSYRSDDIIYGEEGLYSDLIDKVAKTRRSFIGLDEEGHFLDLEPVLSSRDELLGVLLISYNFLNDEEIMKDIKSKVSSDIFFSNGLNKRIWIGKDNKIRDMKDIQRGKEQNVDSGFYSDALEVNGREYFFNLKKLIDYTGEYRLYYAVLKDKIKITELKNSILYNMILISCAGVFFASILIIVLSNILLKPLKKLEISAKAISRGDYSIKITGEYKSEIGNLAEAFNNMTDKIRESIDEIKEKESEYTSLVENLNIGVYRTDANQNGRIIKANQAAANIMGLSFVSELLDRSVLDFYENEKTRDSVVAILKSQGKIRDLVIPFRKATGEHIWCSLSGSISKDVSGEIKWIDGTIEDITERRENEEELKKYKEQLEVLVNDRTKELSNAMDRLKRSQNKLIESEKMAALGQLVSGVAHEINTPLGAINSSIDNILRALKIGLEEYLGFMCTIPENLRAVFKEILARALKNESLITTREERKIKKNIKTKLELFQVEKAHLIADILVDIGIYSEYEKYIDIFKNEKIEEVMELIHKMSGLKRNADTILTATNQASKVVFALKTFSHYDHIGEMVEADIIKGIETVLTLYHNKMKYAVELIREYDDVPTINCYPDELNQVWTNIIHNALQAMDYKGELIIRIKNTEFGIDVSVIDNGPGIEQEIKEKIFNPFFTTKEQGEGSGLGLDIVRKIIEKHKGEIRVDSKPGRTEFTVSLKV